jgi:hypothetical protein
MTRFKPNSLLSLWSCMSPVAQAGSLRLEFVHFVGSRIGLVERA